MSYVLGFDLGTSSLKVSLYNQEGIFIASASNDFSLISDQKGYSEQDSNGWIMALDKVFLSLINKVDDLVDELEGLSFSCQIHSLMLIDENLKVLRKAILWNDVRTTKQRKFIMDEFGDTLLEITNNIELETLHSLKFYGYKKMSLKYGVKFIKLCLPKIFLFFSYRGIIYRFL